MGFIGTLCHLTALRWPCAGPAARGARIPTFNAVSEVRTERSAVEVNNWLIFNCLGGDIFLIQTKVGIFDSSLVS